MLIKRKYKICRRVGDSVFNKCMAPTFSRSMAAKKGGVKKRAPKARSEYASQLAEKQKARYTYLIKEKQFSNYVEKAERTKSSSPAELLYKLLEQRLDNVVYRAGIGKTRAAARQFVSHGHIWVNNARVTVPSYQINIGDKIAIRQGSRDLTAFKDLGEKLKNYKFPKWLRLNADKTEIEVISSPSGLGTDSTLNLNSVMEFYSRT